MKKEFNDKFGTDNNFKLIRPNISKNKIDFQLYNLFQPGVFQYDVWIKSNQSGKVYLKAYEITQGTQLSAYELKNNASVKINNTNGVIEKFSTKNEFIIDEGDWGKPYGARVEIWFKPDNEENEKKITEKKYIIEGWQR